MFSWTSVSPPFPPRGEGGRGAFWGVPWDSFWTRRWCFRGRSTAASAVLHSGGQNPGGSGSPTRGRTGARLHPVAGNPPVGVVDGLLGRGSGKGKEVRDRAYPGTEVGS
jgi:hypothetical protein